MKTIEDGVDISAASAVGINDSQINNNDNFGISITESSSLNMFNSLLKITLDGESGLVMEHNWIFVTLPSVSKHGLHL